MTKTIEEILAMSDEELANVHELPQPVEPKEEVVVVPEVKTEEVIVKPTEEVVAPIVKDEDLTKTEVVTVPVVEGTVDVKVDASKVEVVEQPIDYKVQYEGLLAPLKANGKTIELKSPDELRQLAQMGANYTKNMQQLAPDRKILKMLENNGIKDEAQLSFFIDLKNKNPEAIKKLIKESGIDVMDIDTSQEPNYVPGDHKISDVEDRFQTTLNSMRDTDDGKETLQIIHTTWDDTSKNLLWENPDIMSIMNEQRRAGVYDLISNEVERQRVLGIISPAIPFVHAYKTVGDQMVKENKFAGLESNQQTTNTTVTPVTPIATKVATPKPQVANNNKAAAASVTPTSAKPVLTNDLSNMKDEDFMKIMNGRL